MMRTVDCRTAAIVLCLLGYLVSKAVTKTLREDSATEGKCFILFYFFSPPFALFRRTLLVSWLMLLACSDADVTKTWLTLAS